MNQYVTGTIIKELREKNKLTQLQLSEKLGVSDKTVSKWETGKGYPDITLLEPIAEAFRISVTELISGNTIHNANVSANMLKAKFYVCPVCGNVIHSMGEIAVHCHGIQLDPLEAEPTDEKHMVFIERVEDEYYVRIDHSMTKEHYISFEAADSSDGIQMVKL
jgi:DNA-binding XRE family transcriptional regulator